MPVWIIDTLKPKNGLDFPVVEAVDVAVEGYLNLADAVTHFATDTAIAAINAALDLKADKTTTANLQAQIDQIEISASAESVVAPEVAAARVGADGTSYNTLKARLDSENAKTFQFRGELSDLNYQTIAEAIQIGCYNSRSTTTETLSDKPDGVTGAFSLYVNKWSTGEVLGTVQLLISATGAVYQRFLSYSGTVLIDWASTSDTSSQFRGELAALGYTSISQARKIGCYSSLTATTASLPDKPAGVTGAFSLIVNSWLSDGSLAPVQILITRTGDVWQRFLNVNGNVVIDWASRSPEITANTQAIDSIKSEIYDKTPVVMGLTIGKFWDISGEVAELKEISSWYASAVISVSEGEEYTVYADQGSSHKTRVWTLCDDDLNIVARAEDIYDDIMVEETFVVPHGATKLVISHKSHVPDEPYLKKKVSKFDELNSEFIELKSEIEDIKTTDGIIIPVTMEIGGISSYGTDDDTNSKRARTPYFLPSNVLMGTLHFPPNTKHRFAFYSIAAPSAFNVWSDWSTETEDDVTFPSGVNYSCFRILIGYSDDRDITEETIPYIWFEFKPQTENKIESVEGYYISSDVPAIGVNSAFLLSPIIPVESGVEYKATKFRNTLTFDEDLYPQRLLSTADITDNTILIEENEKYICYCWRKTDCDEMFFAPKDEYIEGATIENLVPIPLIGKKLSLLGDSISAYAGTIPEGNDVYYTGNNSGVSDYTQMWWSVLCRKTGMIPCVINGWSGSGITQLTDSAHLSKVPMSDTSRCQALHDNDEYPDVILIAGGVNDYSYARQASQKPSGWDGKTAPISGNSFDETYAVMIKNIQTAYPNAVVVCLSTWFTMRGTDNGYTLLNGEGLTQTDYDKAIERVAKYMRVPFINVERCGFSRSNFYPTFAEDSSSIPTHPNARGQRTMGEFLADVLPQIVNSFTQNVPEYEPEE